MEDKDLTGYQRRMIVELGAYIEENGCRPRAVRDKRSETDRREDAMYHFAWKAIKAGKTAVIEALRAIGYFDAPTWKEKRDRDLWLRHCGDAASYVADNGHLPPQVGECGRLAHWCCQNRAAYAKGDLEGWQAALLLEAGVVDAQPCRVVERDEAWFASSDEYAAFISEHGRIPVRVNVPATEADLREDQLCSWWDNSVAVARRFSPERTARIAELSGLRERLAPPPGGCSIADRALFEAVSSLFPECGVEYRAGIGDVGGPGREVDVLVSGRGVAIEFGSYRFHRDKANEDVAKAALCAAKGVRLAIVIEGVPEEDLGYRASFEGVPNVVLIAERASASAVGMARAANLALGALLGDAAPVVDEGLMASCIARARDYVGANRAWYLHADEVEEYALSRGPGRECRPPRRYRSEVDGIDLNRWSVSTLHKYRTGRLSAMQVAYLDAFGFADLLSYGARSALRAC